MSSNTNTNSADSIPAWCRGMIRKRPECAQLVYAMVTHGIRTGRVTAEDVHHIPVTHPNARGAAAKLLRRCGFTSERLLTGSTRRSHGHYLLSWRLLDYDRAHAVVDAMAELLTGVAQEKDSQMVLL